MIDAGLPQSRSEWPDGILDELRKFTQGDLVALPPIGYFADPTSPIWEASRVFANELITNNEPPQGDFIYFPDRVRPPYGMITTQTCDLVEEDSSKPRWPWIQLVPVYDMAMDLNSGQKGDLKKGKGRYHQLHIPALEPGFYVADLRLSLPVEKGWLAKQERIDGFSTEELRQRVADRLALLAGRPAFAGSFVSTIQGPLISEFKTLKTKNREAFDRLDDAVAEVGVKLDKRLDPSNVQVVVICNTQLTKDQLDWWNSWHDACRQKAAEVGIALQALDFKLLDSSYSAAEYRQLTLLPLVNISPD